MTVESLSPNGKSVKIWRHVSAWYQYTTHVSITTITTDEDGNKTTRNRDYNPTEASYERLASLAYDLGQDGGDLSPNQCLVGWNLSLRGKRS